MMPLCVGHTRCMWLISPYDRYAHHRADRRRVVDWQPGRRKSEYSQRVTLFPLAPDPEQQRIRELFRHLAEVSDPAKLRELKAELRHLLTAHALLQKPSPRQLRLIEMVALGLKNREIAKSLRTTEQVVKNDLHKIYTQLRVENRIRLALWYEEQRHPDDSKRT